MELLEEYGGNGLLTGLSSCAPAQLRSLPVNPTVIVTKLMDCYRDIENQREQQATLRTQIREYSRMCIATIESNTRMFEAKLNAVKEERMELVRTVCDIARRKEIDEMSLRLCEMFLNILFKDSSWDEAERFLQIPSGIPGLTERRVI